MEEIIQFPFEIRDYGCDVRKTNTGPHKFRKLEELLQLPLWVSHLGTPEGCKIDTNIRNSGYLERVFDFDIQPELVENELQNLVPEEKHSYIQWKPKQKYSVIVYERGGFFKAHSDVIINKYHYGTLLIFPPAIGECSHTGGNLLITKKNGEKFLFESSKNFQWTILAFDPRLIHEILPITSGKRVVLKTELCFSKHPIQKSYFENDPGIQILDGSVHRYFGRDPAEDSPPEDYDDETYARMNARYARDFG